MNRLFRTTRGKIIFGAVFGLWALGAIIMRSNVRRSESSLYESCANHVAFIADAYLRHISDKDKRIDPAHGNFILHLPYDPNLPGYAVFAQYTSGVFGAYVNCNHGAPDCNFDGWQALNLPEESLKKLQEVWGRKVSALPQDQETGRRKVEGSLPYAWCGGPPGGGFRRTCVTIGGGPGPQGWEWSLERDEIYDDSITLLNECLKNIGEKEIPINVPKGIDWKKYMMPVK